MVNEDPQKIVCIGYMPCLDVTEDWQAGQFKESTKDNLEGAFNRAKNPNADACLWAYEQNDPNREPAPVLVYEDADEICEHLTKYSEGHPEDWFTLYYDFEDKDYTAVLIPNSDKMFHRFVAARKFFHKDYKNYKKEDITFVFSPLRIDVFGSETIGSIIDRITSRSETMIGFLDAKHLDSMRIPDSGTSVDPRWIGPVRIGDASELGEASQFLKRKKE